MRVLFTTWAWPSHYFPMVALGWALRAAGHEVRMTSQPELLPTMRSSGLPATAVGRDLDVAAAFHREKEHLERAHPTQADSAQPRAGSRRPSADEVADGLIGDLAVARLEHGADATRRIDDEARSMFRSIWSTRTQARPSGLAVYADVADAMIDDLLALARAWRPDLIVFDPMTHAGPLAAHLLGVPAVRNLFGPDVTYFARATGEAGLTPLLGRFGLDDLDLHGVATVDTCPPSLQIPAPARRIHTRFVAYNGPSEVPGWLLEAPARPRICLTWGTSTDRLFGRKAFLPDEVIAGCAKLADERGADLILAITPSQRSLLPDLPSVVQVVEGVALDALLPSCQAIIHQGGAGTMLTAFRHGLPQIIAPQLVDQAANACRMVSVGAGRTRPAIGLGAADLLALGHDLLDDPAYGAAARRIQSDINEQPSPADVVGQLAALI